MAKLILLTVFLFILLGVGVLCLFFPYQIRLMAIRIFEIGPTSKIDIIKEFLQSSSYLMNIRCVGVGALAMFSLLILFFLVSSGCAA